MLALFVRLLCSSFYIISAIVSVNADYPPQVVNTCTVGQAIQNNCSSCYCSIQGYNKCEYRNCDKVTELAGVFLGSSQLCTPNQLYVQDMMICVCNMDGTWPHRNCVQTFLSLPETSVRKLTCEPRTYVKIGCNICWCGADGEIAANRCTKNTCEDKTLRRKLNRFTSRIFSDCKRYKWYSLGPCQFCYCVKENKLICNTGQTNTKTVKTITMGLVKPQACDPNILKELVAFTSQKKYVRKGKKQTIKDEDDEVDEENEEEAQENEEEEEEEEETTTTTTTTTTTKKKKRREKTWWEKFKDFWG